MLDHVMLASLDALDELLATYTKEEFIKEMNKYEQNTGIRIDDINFNSPIMYSVVIKSSYKIQDSNLSRSFDNSNANLIGMAA